MPYDDEGFGNTSSASSSAGGALHSPVIIGRDPQATLVNDESLTSHAGNVITWLRHNLIPTKFKTSGLFSIRTKSEY